MSNNTQTQTQAAIDTTGVTVADHTALYLDPERREVYAWHDRSSCPAAVWNNRHASLGVVNGAVSPEWLRDYLSDSESLPVICAGYLGDEWDGHNHIGRWTEGAQEAIEGFQHALHDACMYAPKVWSADDWICGDVETCKRDAIAVGGVAKWAAQEASSADAVLDAGDLAEVMSSLLREDMKEAQERHGEIEEELEEEDLDEDGREELEEEREGLEERIAKLQEVLAN